MSHFLSTFLLAVFLILTDGALVRKERRDLYHINMAFRNVNALDRFWYFRHASRRWQKVIKTGLPNVQIDRKKFGKSPCGPYPRTIDDLYLCIEYRPTVDGSGGFLMASGVIYARSSDKSFLPYVGWMMFDRDDLRLLRRPRNDFFNLIVRRLLLSLVLLPIHIFSDILSLSSCYSSGKWATQSV